MSAIGMYHLLRRLAPARAQLAGHDVYSQIRDLGDIRIFMEHHIFAVWDFMSLLKALQQTLTCTEVPWFPKGTTRVRRLINDIVLEEETDEIDGAPTSHFEFYLSAMKSAGADTGPIESMLAALPNRGLDGALAACGAPIAAIAFVGKTFEFIRSGKPHVAAAAFTFGREEPIPGMFRTLVSSLEQPEAKRLSKLAIYLDRHIGLDEDHHAPMAVEMLAELCGDDEMRWNEATDVAIAALAARLSLWSAISSEVQLARMGVPRRQAA